MNREVMEYDVVIVGGGVSGLSSAIKLKQLAQSTDTEISVCLVEKGSEIGAHTLSGAVIEDRALRELFPEYKEMGAPLDVKVLEDEVFFLLNETKSIKTPNWAIPKSMHNHGNYIISLGNLARWLGDQAEQLGVEIYPGFTADSYILEDGKISGIVTGDKGLDAEGNQKDSYMQGMELRAKYTIFSEGSRGHLGKKLISEFGLDNEKDPQHYALGIKELWDIDPDKHKEGLVIHGAGWPLNETKTAGGFFLYHTANFQVVVGQFVDLSYSNPYLSPFDEFQKLKHHPVISKYLEGGKRVSYGARSATKGGINCLPKMTFPGGILSGCDAGTLNFSKIKGVHTSMKTGMIAAESIFNALSNNRNNDEVTEFNSDFEQSWVYEELYNSRNFGPAMHKFGMFFGAAFNYIDQNILSIPVTLHDKTPDHNTLTLAENSKPIEYPSPDGKLSFSKLDSVFLSNTNHAENQKCHLVLTDKSIPLGSNLHKFAEPAQRYCPAGVYEILESNGQKRFQINSQNCVHCKTCDIKDPAQNITWTPPEGGGGPNYPNM